MLTIDHMKSASTRGPSGNAVTREAIFAYPGDGADDGWSSVVASSCGRSAARSVLVGAA
jgi:hypothetical protein